MKTLLFAYTNGSKDNKVILYQTGFKSEARNPGEASSRTNSKQYQMTKIQMIKTK
jgi:hypothetical protein